MTDISGTPDLPNPQQWTRTPMGGSFVAVMNHRRLSRNMTLEKWTTRVVAEGSVHELVTVPTSSSRDDKTINDVAYLGFVVFSAGLLAVGDEVRTSDNTLLGRLFGFDETHMPNHLNILLASDDRRPGSEIGLKPAERVTLSQCTPESFYREN